MPGRRSATARHRRLAQRGNNRRRNVQRRRGNTTRVPSGKPRVKIKPKQRPKHNVLGRAVGTLATAGIRMLDNHYLGGAGHKIWTSLTGSGDYVEEAANQPFEVTANTIVHPTLTPTVPLITDEGGMVRVRHREFITDIRVDYEGNSSLDFVIQPGSARTFPWLSSVGQRFQQYKLLGGVLEYVTLSGNAVSSVAPALGQINMVAQYDVARAPLEEPVERLNTYFSNAGIVSDDLMMALECETTEQPCQVYNIRDPAADNKSQPVDLRWYDFCRVTTQIRGAPPSPDIGETWIAGQLWFTYDILLIKPVYYKKQDFGPTPYTATRRPSAVASSPCSTAQPAPAAPEQEAEKEPECVQRVVKPDGAGGWFLA